MSNIVNFPGTEPKPNLQWVCECGCSSFFLAPDGILACENCEKVVTEDEEKGGWHTPKLQREWIGATPISTMKNEFPLARIAKQIQSDELVTVIAFFDTGRVLTWQRDKMTPEIAEWLRKNLKEAERMLKLSNQDQS